MDRPYYHDWYSNVKNRRDQRYSKGTNKHDRIIRHIRDMVIYKGYLAIWMAEDYARICGTDWMALDVWLDDLEYFDIDPDDLTIQNCREADQLNREEDDAIKERRKKEWIAYCQSLESCDNRQ